MTTYILTTEQDSAPLQLLPSNGTAPITVDTTPASSLGGGDWPTVLAAGPTTGANSPALSAGQAFVDELPGDGWRCTTQNVPVGNGPLTFFSCGNGSAFGGTFAVQSGRTVGGGNVATLLLGSSSPTAGAGFAVNAGNGGGIAGVASGTMRFGTAAPGPGGNQGDWAVTGPGACLGVQARASLPANVLNTMGGYWGLISGPSSVPMYRDNVGADRQLQYAREETFMAYASANATVAVDADTDFHEVPGAGFGVSSASAAFSLGADCVATYGGTVTKKFCVRVFCTSIVVVGAGFGNYSGCIAHNGDVLGTAAGTQKANGELSINETGAGALDDVDQRGSFERIVTLAPGDTVQPAIAHWLGPAVVTLDVTGLTMTITEVN